jgi:triosephosphate isomerase
VNPFRRPLIAGNWKMNAGGQEACLLAHAVAERTRRADRVDVVVAPPFTAIAAVAHEIEETRGSIDVTEGFGVGVAAQNMHHLASGAFTGEISPPMLRDAGATWAIIGHSERRQLFHETDDGVSQKTKAAIEAEIRPIVCVGETLAEREAGETLAVVERQMRAFMQCFEATPGFGVVAYEPVWAIGTGKVAEPSDAQEVHARIRELLAEVSEEVAEATRILYGGSVKGDNAGGLLGQEDVDGALVGGASLDAEGFGRIVDAAQRIGEELAEQEGLSGPPSGKRNAMLDADSGTDDREEAQPSAAGPHPEDHDHQEEEPTAAAPLAATADEVRPSGRAQGIFPEDDLLDDVDDASHEPGAP